MLWYFCELPQKSRKVIQLGIRSNKKKLTAVQNHTSLLWYNTTRCSSLQARVGTFAPSAAVLHVSRLQRAAPADTRAAELRAVQFVYLQGGECVYNWLPLMEACGR